MRSFVAILLTKQIRQALTDYQADLGFAGVQGNYTSPEYQHLTLADAGIPFDRKRFRPHITLIRKAAVFPDISALSIQPPAGRMLVRKVYLMQSVQGKHGMIYHEIGSID